MTATPSRRWFSSCNCGLIHEPGLNRRDLLIGGALAFGAAATSGLVPKAAAQAGPHRIDVHHHISAPSWVDALKSMKRDSPPITNWSVQKTIEDMDAGGVATAMTSPTTPQLQGLDAATAARVAKESNEFAKKLEADHPGRFGTWAMLPLPHVDESLKAIEYAFDTLKADGVGIMTSYGDRWLGYQEFEPVWQELNRRKAIVYTHPTAANCCVNLVRGVDEAYIEFGTDTTRSIFSMIFSGFAEKYPDINWIWSHGGGSITAFYERFTVQALMRPPYKDKFTRDRVEQQIRRFYYDTAAIPNDVTLSALAKMVPSSQILYGTDFPYRRAAEYTKPLAGFFKPDDLKAVDRDNALRLVPRLKVA
jgi:predicted TIM-barrel fold metal-dependent hydrolase